MWAALMKAVADILILMFVVGTPYIGIGAQRVLLQSPEACT
jgi:hypothetical protein